MLAKQALDQLSHLPSLSHFFLSAFFMVVVVMVCVCVCVCVYLLHLCAVCDMFVCAQSVCVYVYLV